MMNMDQPFIPTLFPKKNSGPVLVEILQGGHHMPHRESKGFVLTLIEEFLA
jgi:hypothetical protein